MWIWVGHYKLGHGVYFHSCICGIDKWGSNKVFLEQARVALGLSFVAFFIHPCVGRTQYFVETGPSGRHSIWDQSF
jgi:hypothetical protein